MVELRRARPRRGRPRSATLRALSLAGPRRARERAGWRFPRKKFRGKKKKKHHTCQANKRDDKVDVGLPKRIPGRGVQWQESRVPWRAQPPA